MERMAEALAPLQPCGVPPDVLSDAQHLGTRRTRTRTLALALALTCSPEPEPEPEPAHPDPDPEADPNPTRHARRGGARAARRQPHAPLTLTLTL